jgi:OHCU decarboxylase
MEQLPEVDSLHHFTQEGFFKVVNILFETAPPLAHILWNARPFNSYEELVDVAEKSTHKMNIEDKIIVLNAHPRIGTNPQLEQISALSYKEQGCDEDAKLAKEKVEKIYAELRDLNEKYETKFGFKFVVFVNGRKKEEIVPILKERLHRKKEEELELGLSEQFAIARDRLFKLKKKPKL